MMVTMPLSSAFDFAALARGFLNQAITPKPATATAELARKFLRFIHFSRLQTSTRTSTKSEGKRLHARIEEFNFEGPVFNRPLLPDELIQPVLLNRAVAIRVGVAAVILTRWSAVKLNREPNRLAILRRSQHQVQIARMKPKRNLSRSRLQYGAFFAHFPCSGQSPLIQRKTRSQAINLARILGDRLSRSKVFTATVSDISLGRTNVHAPRSRFHPAGSNADHSPRDRLRAVLLEQLLNHALGLVIFTLPEVVISNPSLPINEVVRRPILIVEGSPDLVVAVDGNRISDLQVANRLFNVRAIFLERKLRSMHPDNNQSSVFIFCRPPFHIRQRSQAVDAGVSPEINQHNFAAQG